MSFPKAGLYFDYNATALLPDSVKTELVKLLSSEKVLANPSSIHRFGQRSKRLLNQTRQKVADSLGQSAAEVDPEQILFTSSGSEANQWAIQSGFARAKRWIVSSVEHDSVLQMKAIAKSKNIEVINLPVSPSGQPRWEILKSLLGEGEVPTLLSIIYVNNETGVITSLSDLATTTDLARARKTLEIHLDAAQAWGKIPLDVPSLPAEYVTFSGHKISGIGGLGVLWIRPGRVPVSFLPGKQERGRRAGTENLLGVVALGSALDTLPVRSWTETTNLRDWLEQEMLRRFPQVKINGIETTRIGNTTNVSFPGISGEGLVLALDLEGYGLSAGSACASGALEPSHVLLAMGLAPEAAVSSLRISLPPVDLAEAPVLKESLQNFLSVLERTVMKLSQIHQANTSSVTPGISTAEGKKFGSHDNPSGGYAV